MEFTYNASALGAGGVIRRNGVETIIPSIASVALAPTGGAGHVKVTDYYSEVLSFKVAESTVSGSKINGRHTTQTTIYIKDLNVRDSLVIGELRGVVTSESGPDDDHEISLDVSYSKVWVGQNVFPDPDPCVKSLKRYRDLDAIIGATQGLAPVVTEGVVRPAQTADVVQQFRAGTLARLQGLVRDRLPLLGSVMRKVDRTLQDRHHDFDVPGIGKVRFGELMFKPGRRRVNLLRIAFGTDDLDTPIHESVTGPDGGTLTIASVEGNGTPVYP